MKGLILKDFINLKKNTRIFGILIILYGFMAFTQKDGSFFSSIFTMLFAILTMSIYSYDEMAKWDDYALTMPINKDNIVQGKYAMMLLLTAIGTCFNVIFLLIINIISNADNIYNGIWVSFIGAAVVILFYSFMIPFITKLGIEKARFLFFAVYLVPFFVVFIAKKVIKDQGIPMPEGFADVITYFVEHVYIIIPLFVLIALGISYAISIRIYRKKEF